MIPTISDSSKGSQRFHSEINVNDTTYKLQITLFDSRRILFIPVTLFKNLNISNDIYNPFSIYELTIINDQDQIQSGFYSKEQEENTFNFKGNSDELIYIKLEPIINENIDKKHNRNYRLEIIGHILDEQEFEDGKHRYKKFTIIESRNKDLLYGNVPWTTNNVLLKQQHELSNHITQLSDKNRTVYTGEALKNILLEFINKKGINDERWDRGNSKIFYSSTIETSPLETIQHIIDNHISSEHNEPCFLRINSKGQFDFTSISNMYNDIERDDGLPGNDFCGTYKILIDYEEKTKGFPFPLKQGSFFGSLIPIKSHKFLNFVSTDALNNLSSINVINYNFENKRFKIYKKQGDINNAIKEYNDNILTKIRKTEVNKINYIPNKKGTSRRIFNVLYNTNHDDENSVIYEGRNELIKNLLFLSNSIEFVVNGNINLYTGKFLSIERDLEVDTEFQRKLQGIYFIMSVHHTFSQDKFDTSVIATKPHSIQ